MTTTILLLIIYLAFVSLGLPDGVMGVAWPEMRQTFSLPLAGAGVLTIVGSLGTVFSAFSSGHILKKFGTGPVVCASSALTGVAMLGFGLSRSFIYLVILCIPLGIGAGAVDTGLNDYVATHFSSRHMNWLHACWGLGAFCGPLIMTKAIVSAGSWRIGYISVAAVQLTLALIFLLTLGLWKLHAPEKKSLQNKSDRPNEEADHKVILTFGQRVLGGFQEIFHRKGLLSGMLLFFFYVGSETSVGLWSASYLRSARLVSIADAGLWVSVYYGSITVGRILVGLIVEKTGTKTAVRLGSIVSALGFTCLLVPAAASILCPVGLCLIGLGFAPMYPCAMQDTPLHFGRTFSKIAIGYQMGMANIGYTVIPLLVGAVSGATTLWIIPIGAFVFLGGFVFFYEKLAGVQNID
ncbi:MAG: MFS transporter [Eubacteriales bacterium]